MTLTAQLTHEVPSGIQHRGRSCFRDGAVLILEGDASRVRATVQGSSRYHVNLACGLSSLKVWCSCPYFQDNLEACKHIWATLLAAETQGYLGDVAAADSLRLEEDEEPPEWVEEADKPSNATPEKLPGSPETSKLPDGGGFVEPNADVLDGTVRAFCGTIRLKLEQLYQIVPKGENSELTGMFVEELVRGFIQDWIRPCILTAGVLWPGDLNKHLPAERLKTRQIDGIIFDPRLGPAIFREGSFLAAHPAFCRGMVEIKTSCHEIEKFEKRLQLHYEQYLRPFDDRHWHLGHRSVMGVVVAHPDPKQESTAPWLVRGLELFNFNYSGHCPIFILFQEADGVYEPYLPGIKAMIRGIFQNGWQHDLRHDRLGSQLLPP